MTNIIMKNFKFQISNFKLNSGLTLLEVMIVMMLLVLLIIGVLAFFKPQEQIAKAKDAKRKNDLNELRKVFEDWYSDKGCYPKKSEVCYNDLSGTTCEICTSQVGSPSLEAYTKAVVCDPEPSLKNYLYEINGDVNCPAAFLVYTKLSSVYTKENDPYNCTALHACGPSPFFGYDYLVLSSNATIPIAGNFYCLTNQNKCGGCGTYNACAWEVTRGTCSSIYVSKSSCCSSNPGAGNC